MAISRENLIVVYRSVSNDSYAFARHYADVHNLDDSQLVGIPCSGDEILDSYEDFQTQVEDPIRNAIESEYGNIGIWAILLGFGVPGGFRDGSSYISATSRLSRIHHEYTVDEYGVGVGMPNPLFSRQKFTRFDADDADIALIVSRIDAPTLEGAIEIVGNTLSVAKQGVVNGKIFIDPYTTIDDALETSYQNEIFDFQNNLLPLLNIKSYSTTFWDSETDVVIPRLHGDSFMWAWKSDRAGYTFFKDKSTIRVFLYNGDTDGAEKVRDADERRWPMLALSSGYAACAGAMSDPLPEGLLRPKPFFDALFRGATIGEAFLFAIPNLDWTVTLFGDPLVSVTFPTREVLSDDFTEKSGFEIMGKNLQSAIAYYFEREKAFMTAYTAITNSGDVDTLTQLIGPFTALTNTVISKTKSDLEDLTTMYGRFPSESLNLYLDLNDLKISKLLSMITPNIQVTAAQKLPSGSWYFEDEINHPTSSFFTYHFQLQIANDSDFSESKNYNLIVLKQKRKEEIEIDGFIKSFQETKVVFNKRLSLGIKKDAIALLEKVFDKIRLFVDFNSQDLPKLFDRYKGFLDSSIYQMNDLANSRFKMSELNNAERVVRLNNVYKSIDSQINNAAKLVNTVTTVFEGPRSAKQVMLYFVEKYKNKFDFNQL